MELFIQTFRKFAAHFLDFSLIPDVLTCDESTFPGCALSNEGGIS